MKYFCKAPFTQISIDPRGVLLPCCRYRTPLAYLNKERIDRGWNNNNFRNLRREFLEGKKPIGCSDCWTAEQSGNESLRSVINKWAQDLKFDSDVVEHSPLYYEFKTTNVCNLKCRMCGPFNSSSIAKEQSSLEERTFYLQNKILNTEHEPIVLDWIEKSEHILFAGGEPFVNQEVKKIIEYMYKNNLTNKSLLMVTNGTHWNDDFVFQLQQFPRLQIRISLDDIFERNDYQREGSNFDSIEENFLKFSSKFYNRVTFNCTMNWYNIFYINEFLEYSDDFNTPVSIQYVEHPKYLNITNLPENVKQKVNTKFKNNTDSRINLILDRMNLPGINLINDFFKHVKYYDEVRNNSFEKIFPEWHDILNEELQHKNSL